MQVFGQTIRLAVTALTGGKNRPSGLRSHALRFWIKTFGFGPRPVQADSADLTEGVNHPFGDALETLTSCFGAPEAKQASFSGYVAFLYESFNKPFRRLINPYRV
jgi:hypothetical protein